MHRLQELVRLHRLGEGARQVARKLRMSPNTERKYRRILDSAGVLEGDADALPELATLKAIVEAANPAAQQRQQRSSVEKWRPQIEELVDKGAQATAIFNRLRLEHDDFEGTLSAVKRRVAKLRRDKGIDPNAVVIPVETSPGKVAQVDFGSVGKLWDPQQRRLRKAYAFIMVLAHARHQFARLVFDQKVETWLALHVEAFEHFGGVPEVVVPDNLKSAVTRAAFDVRGEPVLNRSYRELARHFGFQIDPTPAYSPEKKGKVESAIRYVKHNFMKTIGDERDIEVLGRQLERWVMDVAGRRRHGTTHRQPLEHFESVERGALRPLPETRWKQSWWREATVHRDCCVLVEKARYSVPWRLVGKKLLVRVTAHSVEVYCNDMRVATHPRQEPGGKSILLVHLPPERGEYRERERDYWVERAAKIGDDVRAYVNEIFDSDEVLAQLNKVQAIVRHLDGFPPERANAA